ncbi:unnamed protein product [Symbiodinium sp. CCMP2592]|nr:unnamed protein product [Symbiodinium sp. CCMP2592]
MEPGQQPSQPCSANWEILAGPTVGPLGVATPGRRATHFPSARSPSRESLMSQKPEQAFVARRFRKDSSACASTVNPIPAGRDRHVLLPLQSVHKARPGLRRPYARPAVLSYTAGSSLARCRCQCRLRCTADHASRRPSAKEAYTIRRVLNPAGVPAFWDSAIQSASLSRGQPPRSLQYVPPQQPLPAPERRRWGLDFTFKTCPRDQRRPTQVTRKGQEASRKAKALEQWKELLQLLGDASDLWQFMEYLILNSLEISQPFAVRLHGISGRELASLWVLPFLRAVQTVWERTEKIYGTDNCPDFILPTLHNLRGFPGKPAAAYHQPMSYSQALGCLRFFMCRKHLEGNSPELLTPAEASAFTMHSLKVCLLSAGAQIQAADKIRQQQGHHKNPSVQLYGRDDTLGALALQSEITQACALGWRPSRPIARGGQHPTVEPPFSVSSASPPESFQLSALGLDTQLAAAETADHQPLPTEAQPEQGTDAACSLPPTIPADDIEALLVESLEEQPPPPTLEDIALFQNGPWGSVHAQPMGADKAACGRPRSTAAFCPTCPNTAFFCRRAACRRLLDALP